MRQLAAGVVGGLLCASLLFGCTSARSSLGTSDSSCYLALPAATHAVGAHAKLLGMQLYTLATLRQKAPHLFTALTTTHPRSERVCVAAFKGEFTAASVADGRGRSSGRLAVVVTAAPSNRLLGTVIFKRAPLRFGHSHFG
jgi:hypothetical protein